MSDMQKTQLSLAVMMVMYMNLAKEMASLVDAGKPSMTELKERLIREAKSPIDSTTTYDHEANIINAQVDAISSFFAENFDV